jgi:hypothetical protein
MKNVILNRTSEVVTSPTIALHWIFDMERLIEKKCLENVETIEEDGIKSCLIIEKGGLDIVHINAYVYLNYKDESNGKTMNYSRIDCFQIYYKKHETDKRSYIVGFVDYLKWNRNHPSIKPYIYDIRQEMIRYLKPRGFDFE